MKPSVRSTNSGAKKRFLEMARQIAEGEATYINYDHKTITKGDYMALVEFSGERELYFDDDHFNNYTDAGHRVLFLCMAATQ